MTDEKREEIIKSLAMDMSVEQIAALEDVPVSEVEQIGEALTDINMEEEVAKCGK